MRSYNNRNRRWKVTGRFYVVMTALVLLIIVGGVATIQHFSKPTQQSLMTPVSTQTSVPEVSGLQTPVAEGISSSADLLGDEEHITKQKEELIKVDNLSVVDGLDPNWRNILLLGQDTYEEEDYSRTDTILIASINVKTGQIRLSSIMRDSLIPFPNDGLLRKINGANRNGGPELVMKTINENFQLNIKEYALVNFSSFPQIIDLIGGVLIDITEEEMIEVNKLVEKSIQSDKRLGLDHERLNNSLLEMHGKATRLTGRQALAFSRLRKIDSDFKRAERQRTVIMAMLDQVKTKVRQDPLSLAQLGYEAMKYINTNINVMTDGVSLAMSIVQSDNKEGIMQKRFPIEGSYVSDTRDEVWGIYDVDYTVNARAMHDFIYSGISENADDIRLEAADVPDAADGADDSDID